MCSTLPSSQMCQTLHLPSHKKIRKVLNDFSLSMRRTTVSTRLIDSSKWDPDDLLLMKLRKLMIIKLSFPTPIFYRMTALNCLRGKLYIWSFCLCRDALFGDGFPPEQHHPSFSLFVAYIHYHISYVTQAVNHWTQFHCEIKVFH